MTNITSSDVTRLARTLDYLRRSIENQTKAIDRQNEILKHNQATTIHLLRGLGLAQEGAPSTDGGEEGSVPGSGTGDRPGGLGSVEKSEGGSETT